MPAIMLNLALLAAAGPRKQQDQTESPAAVSKPLPPLKKVQSPESLSSRHADVSVPRDNRDNMSILEQPRARRDTGRAAAVPRKSVRAHSLGPGETTHCCVELQHCPAIHAIISWARDGMVGMSGT